MLSTAAEQLEEAKTKRADAREHEWNNPTCPEARRMADFWDTQVAEFAGMQPETVIPMF